VDAYSRVLVFSRDVLSADGRRLRVPDDHPLGPSRWSDHRPPHRPLDPEVPELDPCFESDTNLRVCRDDLRVVAVFPRPPNGTAWAPPEACAPREEGPERDPYDIHGCGGLR
jgi:hypothetical protein